MPWTVEAICESRFPPRSWFAMTSTFLVVLNQVLSKVTSGVVYDVVVDGNTLLHSVKLLML